MSNKIKVWEILRAKFPEKEYALMEEVSDAAGFDRKRSADYMAVSLWPSRGCAITGIELKSYRSDWLNELKNPKKAENIFRYCDYFYLLTTDEKIAKMEEIPETWGWFTIKGSRVFLKKEAPKLTPQPITKSFMAAMLKRASDKKDFVHIRSIEDRIASAAENAKKQNLTELENTKKKLSELTETVRQFRETSGIDLLNFTPWQTNPSKIGKVVKFITEEGGTKELTNDLLRLEAAAKKIQEQISANIALFNLTDTPQ